VLGARLLVCRRCFNPRSARVSGATSSFHRRSPCALFQSALRSGERSDAIGAGSSVIARGFNPRSARVSGATRPGGARRAGGRSFNPRSARVSGATALSFELCRARWCFNPRSARVSGATWALPHAPSPLVFQSALRSGERSDTARAWPANSLSLFQSALRSGERSDCGPRCALVVLRLVSIRAPLG